jgi:hypothetical protein
MFVRKFKHLLEMRDADVVPPAEASIRYAVCAYDVDSCGWHGWTLDAVWRAPNEELEERADPHARLLPTASKANCPRCGRPLCDADASDVHLAAAPDPRPAKKIEVTPREYSDNPWRDLADEYMSLGLKRMRWCDRTADSDESHDHCETCGRAVSDDPHDAHEAMSDGRHRWVCLECWARMESASARRPS